MAGGTLNIRLALGIVAVIVVLAVASPWLGAARSGAQFLTWPARPLTAATAGVRRFAQSVRDITTLRSRVAELEEENGQLVSEVARLQEAAAADALITAEYAASSSVSAGQLLSARVIARSPSKALDSITVDRGANHGVALGQPVLARGHLAGIVDEVSAGQARVLLLTNPSLLIPVLFQETRAQGLLRASLGGLVVSDIPSTADIKPGEVVLTNDLEGVVPRGIPVGMVDRTLSATSEILRKERLQSPVPFAQLEYVLVVIDGAAS